MGLDPKDVTDAATSAAEGPERPVSRLNALVAVTVAILATFMGICKVKDDNIVQAMQQAQADKIDHWAFYQARNLRQEIAEATVVQLELARASLPASQAAAHDKAIEKYRALAASQAAKKEELRLQALQDQKTYDDLNYRDDQFDLSDAALAIAIALLAVAALTQLWALYWVALVPIVFGMTMGMAGLAGWSLHPESLVKLLT
jgi:uncharacterized protein DUF4337